MIFLACNNLTVAHARDVQRNDTRCEYETRESNLKIRIPFRWAKELFHARPLTRERCVIRLMGIQPSSCESAAGYFFQDPLNRKTALRYTVRRNMAGPSSEGSGASAARRQQYPLRMVKENEQPHRLTMSSGGCGFLFPFVFLSAPSFKGVGGFFLFCFFLTIIH